MPYRVMTVCTGNICRSPMAEVVLRRRFEEAGLGEDVVVDSGGISDEEDGNPVDRRARDVLTSAGYEVDGYVDGHEVDGTRRHRAHQVSPEEIGRRDLVLAMTSRHARWLRTQAPDPGAAARVLMYRSFDPAAPDVTGPGAVEDESALDIDDPWYGDRHDFETTLEQVEAAADAVVEHVRAALER